jgi:acetolactate synthase-1/2/3 large subunit
MTAAAESGPSTNRPNGAEAMVRLLERQGVTHIFGLCGDTSLPFYDALAQLDHGMRHVLARDERSAAYMADAFARVTGRVGVCEGPSGGGATYILPGVVEANESSVPLLAITTDIATSSRGRFTLTELDQKALFRPLTKWNAVIERATMLPDLLRRAFAEMTSGRPGAAHLAFPYDVQREPVDETALWIDPATLRVPSRRIAPDAAAIEAAAAALSSAAHPILICGGGVVIAGAEAELARLAERLGAPVATTISGQGSIADTHPLALGVVGSNGGTPETRSVVDAADLVLFVGCRAGSVTTERWRHPAPGARILHIDADPAVLGACYPTETGILGDAKLALAALADAVDPRSKPLANGSATAIAAAKRRKFAAFDALAASEERPIRPERVVATLNRLLPEDAVLVCDPGTPCPYFSAFFRWRVTGRHFISNRAHGALGYALPAVAGAQIGRPHAKCVAVMGDGSFAMACGEMETLLRHRLPVTLVVLSNASFGWIKAGQRTGFASRFYSVDFGRTDHARVAEAFGLKAWRVEDPAALEPALKAALAADGPTLVDILVQPLEEARAPVSEWIA